MIQQSRRFSRLHQTRLSWTAALLVVALAWIFLAYSLGPVVIEKAYNGKSLAILNRLITGQATHPLTEYLAHWSRIASKVSFGLVILYVYILLAMVRVAREAPAELHESPGKVAISKPRRLVVYGLGVVIFGGALFDLIRDTEHWPFHSTQCFLKLKSPRLTRRCVFTASCSARHSSKCRWTAMFTSNPSTIHGFQPRCSMRLRITGWTMG